MSWLDKEIELARARKQKELVERERALGGHPDMDFISHIEWLRELQEMYRKD